MVKDEAIAIGAFVEEEGRLPTLDVEEPPLKGAPDVACTLCFCFESSVVSSTTVSFSLLIVDDVSDLFLFVAFIF